MKPAVVFVTAIVLLASAHTASAAGHVTESYAATDYPTGLAWDGTYIWLADRDSDWLYAFDPSTGSMADSIRCPSFSPLGLAFGDGCLWVSGYYEDRIYKVDMAERKVIDTIDAPSSLIIGLAWQDGYLWGCDASAKEIVRFDPASGTPIRWFKAPSSRPHGLAFDGTYLWVSDRYKDKIHMVDPEEGWVIFTLDSPGPYPRGLAWDGEKLWNVDYECDSLYAIAAVPDEFLILDSPKKARVRYTFKLRCEGPDPVETCDIYLAVPHTDLDYQKLLSGPIFTPDPIEFTADRWGQQHAHFRLTDIRPGEAERVCYEVTAEIHQGRQFIIPERVGSLNRVPRDIKQKYTADADRLQIDDPVIQKAIAEAVGGEENPYRMVRKILSYIGDHMEFEMAGGWDTAPNVLKRGTGSCSEYSFVFMAMARGAGIPTRFAAGVVERGDEASMDVAFHRWTEVYLPDYGWVPVDGDAGDREWQADAARGIGSYSNRILTTTIGGGDSEYLGWGYNYGFFHTYSGRTKIDVATYADWEPIAEAE